MGFIERSDYPLRMATKSKKFSKEDELLLQDFSRGVSTKSSALFYGNALIVSSIPVWLYWRVHNIDPASSVFIFAAVILASTWLVSFAYRNTKHLLKHRVAVKREAAATKEMNAKLADDKKISRNEKDERILWKKNEVAEYESTTFAASTTTLSFSQFLFLRPSMFSQQPSALQSITLQAWGFQQDLLHYCLRELHQHKENL